MTKNFAADQKYKFSQNRFQSRMAAQRQGDSVGVNFD